MQSRVDEAIQELGIQNEAFEDDKLERFIEDSLALITYYYLCGFLHCIAYQSMCLTLERITVHILHE